MFRYNVDGYLRPYKAIETSLGNFENEFVFNQHRKQLFDKYLEFLSAIKDAGINNFTQWVNGSFVSKKELPGDIDLVTFVQFDQLIKLESKLKKISWNFGKWIDSSFAAEYPKNHYLNSITLFLKNDYQELYGSTRQNKSTLKSRPKGYLQIQFD